MQGFCVEKPLHAGFVVVDQGPTRLLEGLAGKRVLHGSSEPAITLYIWDFRHLMHESRCVRLDSTFGLRRVLLLFEAPNDIREKLQQLQLTPPGTSVP